MKTKKCGLKSQTELASGLLNGNLEQFVIQLLRARMKYNLQLSWSLFLPPTFGICPQVSVLRYEKIIIVSLNAVLTIKQNQIFFCTGFMSAKSMSSEQSL